MKKKSFEGNIVFSTNPDAVKEVSETEPETLSPNKQKLIIRTDSKHRAGKLVTLIEGFKGKQEDQEKLIKNLKNFCGTGGSAKDGEMLVQGDQRDKIMQWLLKNGYKMTVKR
jgi:translation initiation factor 1